MADSNQNRNAGGTEKDSKGLPSVPPGMRWLSSSMYALGLLVLLVACRVAFADLNNDKAKTIVLLILAAGGLALVPKLIHFLPFIQSFKIGNLEVTLMEMKKEIEEQKSELEDTAKFVGGIVTQNASEAGLLGRSKRSRAPRNSEKE